MPDPTDNEPLAPPSGDVLTPPPATGADPAPPPAATPSDIDVVDQAIAAANAGNGLPPEPPPLVAADADPVNPDADPAATPPEGDPEPAPEGEPEPTPVATKTAEELEDDRVTQELGFKNQKASDEFKSMRRTVRELEPLREPAQKWTQMETYLKEREIQPADFGAAMNVLAAFNSPSIEHKRVAFGILSENLKILGAQIGEEAPGFDPLSLPVNADLAKKVEEEDLDRATALQLARSRSVEAHTTTVTQRQQQTQQQTQAYETARTEAVAALNTLGTTLEKIDPAGFAAKSAALLPVMKPIFARLHPSHWKAAYEEAYANLPAATVPKPTPAPPPLRNQALRPTGAKSNGMAPEIKTDMDAVEAALRAAAELNGVAYTG